MKPKVILQMLQELIEEYDLESKIVNRSYNEHIVFGPKESNKTTDFEYHMVLNNSDIHISRLKLETKTANGRFHLVPEQRILLSVDLHDPRSLKAIREWLETL